MKKSFKNNKIFLSIIVIIIGFIIFCIWENNSIVLTKSTYTNSKIPDEFDDFVICHISDLHNKEFGENQSTILKKINNISPDIIVITGDLIDRRKYNLDIAMTFINGAVEIAPVYYVSGNHEAWSNKYTDIKNSLTKAGVNVLDNSMTQLTVNGSSIDILGLSDPDFLTSNYIDGTDTAQMVLKLNQWSDNQNFKILLSHRPELFDLYAENNIDLIFCGHAHGGQFRLPFIGGLIAPDQGFFPKYTSGHYKQNTSTMFVSRGLGNSIIPLRIFNKPEIVVVTLKSLF